MGFKVPTLVERAKMIVKKLQSHLTILSAKVNKCIWEAWTSNSPSLNQTFEQTLNSIQTCYPSSSLTFSLRSEISLTSDIPKSNICSRSKARHGL